MSSNGTATEPPSSQPPAPSSAAPVSTLPPSSNPPPSSAPPSAPAQSSAAAPPASTPTPVATSVVTAPSAPPSATEIRTSLILVTQTPSAPGESPAVVTVVSTITPSNQPSSTGKPGTSPSSTGTAGLQGAQKDGSGGLSTGGKTAIAVVIPVVAVALLVLGAILFWRRRKQRKDNEDERRKEVEEYGYNPNHDPTLPAVGVGGADMSEDSSGYRGWGNTATSSGRKASTTLTSGMTYSDSNSNPGGYISPNSPTNAFSDANSNDPLVNGRRETLDADGIAALGAAPTANHHGVHRGPSNASSSYSAANHSDNSGDYPGMSNNNPQEYYEQGYGSYQDGPYGSNGAYGGGQQPVIRDVSARRNTRIENPSVFPQGNSGVATNF